MLDTSFRSFFDQTSEQIILSEEAEGVLQHLTHLEELILTSKQQGLQIAIQFLKELYDTLKGNMTELHQLLLDTIPKTKTSL